MELLRDRGQELVALGVQPYGISRDSPWTHVAWTQALDLNFPLLSDWNGEATHGFDIAYEHRGLKDVSARSAFLIDTEGTCLAAWRYEPAEVPDLGEIIDTSKQVLSPSG